MEIGLIGLPKSGKTTVFNSLTRGKAETSPYASANLAPNIGVVKVPDQRIDTLAKMFKPEKVVPAEVKYVDIGVPLKGQDKKKGEGLSGEMLSHISRADTLFHVVRAFPDESIPHPRKSVDPARDIADMNLELNFSDLAIVERRLERLEGSLKSAKAAEREMHLQEKALLERIKQQLEAEVPIREQTLTADEAKTIENYQFLTAKPLLIVVNIGEGQLGQAGTIEAELRSRFQRPRCEVAALCGKVEMELSQLSGAEAAEFRSAMGATGMGIEKIVQASYSLLGLISFFTVGEDEVRAWTIRRGTPAVKAAGKIHSDLEKGFIRAEVISYDDLMKCGAMVEAKKRGLLRLEGKTYTVQDGDIMEVLFNV
ncbi:MAG: redox-regulated ATPase YchF [Dehalococcoidia bacterium]|nr:redox-regulated ATPase YchF [Dehalococcoidia bacterium]